MYMYIIHYINSLYILYIVYIECVSVLSTIQYDTCTYYFHNNILSSYMYIINWPVYINYNI